MGKGWDNGRWGQDNCDSWKISNSFPVLAEPACVKPCGPVSLRIALANCRPQKPVLWQPTPDRLAGKLGLLALSEGCFSHLKAYQFHRKQAHAEVLNEVGC